LFHRTILPEEKGCAFNYVQHGLHYGKSVGDSCAVQVIQRDLRPVNEGKNHQRGLESGSPADMMKYMTGSDNGTT
jgi:hypothetical protein